MLEQFKTIIEFPNYEVSSLGKVRNLKTKKACRLFITGLYQRVKLFDGSKYHTLIVKDLVAKYFIENLNNFNFVTTYLKDSETNTIENLFWSEKLNHNILESYEVCNRCLDLVPFLILKEHLCVDCQKVENYSGAKLTKANKINDDKLAIRYAEVKLKAEEIIQQVNDPTLQLDTVRLKLFKGKCEKTHIIFDYFSVDYTPVIVKINKAGTYEAQNILMVCNILVNPILNLNIDLFINKYNKYKPRKVIFIPYNTASSKNSRSFNLKMKRSFYSKIAARYVRDTKYFYTDYREHFLDMLQGKSLPVEIRFTFVRDSNRTFDLINAAQIVQDLMVKNEWIEDDNQKNLIPSFGETVVNKAKPGVYIDIL